jgi:hypothetical protein
MKNHHRAPQEMADVEACALSLRFRQHAYDTAVKAQRELIRAGMRVAKRRLSATVGLFFTTNRTAGLSNPPLQARRTCTANIA